MAEENKLVQFKCEGFVVHLGEPKRDGDVIAISEEAAERLSKLGKGKVVTPAPEKEEEGGEGENGGEEDGVKLENLKVAELDSFAQENGVEDYPKKGNRDEKIEAIELHLENLSEQSK